MLLIRSKSAQLRLFDQFKEVKRNFAKETARKPSYVHYIGKEPLVYRTVGEQLELSVQQFGNNEAIVSCHENKRFTYKEIIQKADALAAGFRKLGLERGDLLGIWAPNSIQWYLTMLAALRAGLVSVGINPAFQSREVEYCINKVGMKAIICPESYKTQHYYELLSKIDPEILKGTAGGPLSSQKLPSLKSVIIDTVNQLPGSFKFEEILEIARPDEVAQIGEDQHLVHPDAPCNVQFTSGTTGNPKAAILSHYNFVNNGIHVGNRNELREQRICVQVPLFHAYGVVITIMAGISHGATLVLPGPGFNPEQSLRAIVNEKCSVIHGTPTMYVDLIAKQKELQLPIDSAKIAVTGGASCSPQLFRSIRDVLGLEKVKTVFGMTETTAVIFQSLYNETEEQVLNTVGHIQDHVEAKVIDLNGDPVPFGQPGELCVRGYVSMLEYYGDDEKSRETIGNDRWLKTGDQFILEESGYGRIVGRLKEVIIRGGENIFPKEIENLLDTHPDILETHVIGVDDERMGEEICAFIRLRKADDQLTREQIKEYCTGRIAHFKIPRYVRIIEDFPKTASGKIQKFQLKEIFANDNKMK